MERREEISAALEQNPLIRMAVLFGSRARGDARENSDYDIAIDFAGLSSRDPLLAYNIAHDGIPLVERTIGSFLAFKNDACTRYFDIQDFLDTQHAFLSQRIESGSFGRARHAPSAPWGRCRRLSGRLCHGSISQHEECLVNFRGPVVYLSRRIIHASSHRIPGRKRILCS